MSQFLGPVVDPGIPASISPGAVPELLKYQRYENGNANAVCRAFRELERAQRRKTGGAVVEHLAVAAIVGLNLRAETGTANSSSSETAQSQAEQVAIDRPALNEVAKPSPASGETIPDGKDSAAELTVSGDQASKASPARAPWSPNPPGGPLWRT